MRLFLLDMGIPDPAMILEDQARTTRENASLTKEIVKDGAVALVTSAFHMPRAKHLFERQGLEVQTYPVDFKVEANKTTLLDFLPSAYAMKNFEFAIRELLGRIYYQLKDQ